MLGHAEPIEWPNTNSAASAFNAGAALPFMEATGFADRRSGMWDAEFVEQPPELRMLDERIGNAAFEVDVAHGAAAGPLGSALQSSGFVSRRISAMAVRSAAERWA